MATAGQIRAAEQRAPLLDLAAEAERLTNRLEAESRTFLSGNAFSQFEFQKSVKADLVQISRMIRDLARTTKPVESGIVEAQ